MNEQIENEEIVKNLIASTFSGMPSITEEMGMKIQDELTKAYNDAKEFYKKKTESE